VSDVVGKLDLFAMQFPNFTVVASDGKSSGFVTFLKATGYAMLASRGLFGLLVRHLLCPIQVRRTKAYE
jgi:hypothetical protein